MPEKHKKLRHCELLWQRYRAGITKQDQKGFEKFINRD